MADQNVGIQADLGGKVALVTGASSGIGRHVALLLARHGAAVAVAARRRDDLDAVVAAIVGAGGRACAVAMDVTDPASVTAAIDEAQRQLGIIDLLVNNAGIAQTKSALDVTVDDWDRIVDTNLRGAFLVATEVARRLRDAGRGGTIINTASILGLRTAGAVAPYAASKAGLIQLTQSLALELARHDIRVNALAPGYLETEINREFFASPPGQALIKRIPQRRLGRLEDLDGAVLLLASDASRYMTGSVLVVDGGHLVSSL